MGIDIYMKWDGMTQADQEAQITGFDVTAGKVGYLREAYHGGPYVTRFLVAEAFDETKGCQAIIPAKVLRERLPEAIRLAIQRASVVYHETLTENSPRVKAFADFVQLAERMEKRTGKPVTIQASW